ncbi:hypothetical protein D3C75_837200 [compost metagenome]
MFENKFLPIDSWAYDKILSIYTFAKLADMDCDVYSDSNEDCIYILSNGLYIEILITKKLFIYASVDKVIINKFGGYDYERITYFNRTKKYQKLFDRLEPYLKQL